MKLLRKILMTTIPVLLLIADQLTKLYFRSRFAVGQSVEMIPGVLNFTYVKNFGAAFGMMQDRRWVFLVITTVVIVIGVVALAKGWLTDDFQRWAALLIISGGVGNMIDRIAIGFVTDFIDLKFIKFYVFNIADCCVVVGTVMLIAVLCMQAVSEYKSAAARGGETDESD